MQASEHLDLANQAAAARDLQALSQHLLRAWQAAPAPRIADLLERVTVLLEPAASDRHDLPQDAWLAVALADRPEDTPALLESMILLSRAVALDPDDEDWEYVDYEPPPEVADTAERLWALKSRADPRLSRRLCTHLEHPQFLMPRTGHRGGVEEYWEELAETLVAVGDVRAVVHLDHFVQRVPGLTDEADTDARLNMHTQWPLGDFLVDLITATSTALRARDPVVLDARAAAACAAIEALDYLPSVSTDEGGREHADDRG